MVNAHTLIAALIVAPTVSFADPRVDAAVNEHILPRLDALVSATSDLVAADCDAGAAWGDTVEKWVAVSHLRFGPSEENNRAFALAFWPDPRASTPKALHAMLAQDAFDVSGASIAGRGFYAMEFLLFDEAFYEYAGTCDLIAALALDIDATAQAIQAGWQDSYADLIQTTGNDVYRTETESLQELYKSIGAGLEFTIDQRLGRPLGTFERPRPTRAEMRRSGRALDNIAVSLESLTELAHILADDAIDAQIAELNARAQTQIARLADLEGGADLSLVDRPADRFKVEALHQNLTDLHNVLTQELGPQLGVVEGFNSLDGD